MKDKMKQRRVIFIDYIRALAILMVIMCHVIDVNCLFWLGYQDMSGARQIILYTLLIFGRCGVPLFLMITGYLLLDRDYSQGKWKSFYLHKWLHLFLLTEIWFIIYEGFSVFVQGNPFVGKNLVLRLLFVKEPALSHAWYLPVILGLYLLLPVFALVWKKLSNRGCLIIVILLWALVLLLQNFAQESMAQHITYALYMLIGGAYKRWNTALVEHKKAAYTIYSLAGIFALAGCEGYLWLQHRRGENVSLWYDPAGIVLLSLALFGFAMFLVQKNCSFVERLSQDSFGIYLIHNMIALMMMPWLSQWNSNLYLKMILTYLLVWGIAWGLVRLIGKIPYVGDWILYKRRLK